LTVGTLSVGSDLTFIGAGDTLINGQMYGSGGVTKNGTGTLNFDGGASSNAYSGATNVNDGTLLLNKNAGTTAIGSSSTLTIGDGSGTAGSAIVQLGNSNQIADSTPTVAIASDGRLDLDGNDEAFNTLSGSGEITLGSGTFELGINSGSSSYAD
jgi:fibronectin-binding autotransporter adhesin